VPAQRSATTPPGTRFIGRARGLDDCAALMNTARLLTLTGLGGLWQDRVAIKVRESGWLLCRWRVVCGFNATDHEARVVGGSQFAWRQGRT
jgi:hypothetical protein